MSVPARLYLGLTVFVGTLLIAVNLSHWDSANVLRFLMYLVGAILASNMKVRLPGIQGTISVSFTFILIGVVELSLPQTLAIACLGALAQVLWRTKHKPKPIQVFFNLASITIASECAFLAYHSTLLKKVDPSLLILLLVGASVFYLVNTFSVSGIIALTEKKRIWNVWHDSFLWTVPQYLVGAALAAFIHYENRFFGWQATVLTCPVIYLVYRSLGLYLERLEEDKRHAAELADLHWRTIEALALAIEAKDNTTHQHLRRVRVYATEIGKQLGLDDLEMQAVQAAALLHDIGKLAVPEYIISKPGKLTPEEFEKMKIHPGVGADILARVGFPYPVVPIVRAHHEKWNGTGYPTGLKGEEIPIGARIISAVDCLDALASERQYRRALPLNEAMEIVKGQSGTSFDPAVIDILSSRFVELEQLASQSTDSLCKLDLDVRVDRGDAPAAGFETSARMETEKIPEDCLSSIAVARQEFQMLLEITSGLGAALRLDETLALFASRLKRMVPHDSVAIYTLEGEQLHAQLAQGEDSKMFGSLHIPVGQGLSGWVVENNKPMVNGNPSVEPGYLNDPAKFSTLRSALSVPLEGASGVVVGALTLYSLQADFFTREHLRVLQAIVSKAGPTIVNALQLKRVESGPMTDSLTGLPDARSLVIHLDAELTKAKEKHADLSVVVLDFNNFKAVNDRFGHFAGDRIFQTFAQRVQSVIRESDYVARTGGDEFVLVLPGACTEDLEHRVDSLHSLVREIGTSVCFEPIVSLSVGIASYPTHGDHAEQLLAAADRMMYGAKQSHHRAQPPAVIGLNRPQLAIQ